MTQLNWVRNIYMIVFQESRGCALKIFLEARESFISIYPVWADSLIIPEGTGSAMIPQVCADIGFSVLMLDEPV